MSLETILLIGILTIDAIALGVDCLWSLSIRFPWLNISDLNKETDANYFFEMIVNAQRQTNQFPIVILLIVLAGAIATPAEARRNVAGVRCGQARKCGLGGLPHEQLS